MLTLRRRFKKSGQSTLEYILILTGLIAAIVIGKQLGQNRMGESLNKAADKIVLETDRLMDESF